MNLRASIAIVLLLLPALAPAAAPSTPATDRIIVKWRDADFPAAAARVQALGERVNRPLSHLRHIGGGMSVVRLPRDESGATLATTLAALRADPQIELAEPDRRVRLQAYVPNDPQFSESQVYFGEAYDRQWYLKGAQIAATRADTAWDTTRGGTSPDASPVVVAVLDTGVRPGHPDLAGKLLPGYDFVSNATVANDGNEWDTDPTDPGDFITADDLQSSTFRNGKCGAGSNFDQPVNSSWHGTRVSGLIAAGTDNGVGMAGLGFNVRVLPVRVLGKCGGFESDVIAGMYWAAGLAPPPPTLQSTSLPPNAHPAQILNMSLGSDGACTATYATAVRDITARGVLIVASAGNDGAAVGTPASCAGVLAVAGVRHAGTKVGYSNLGPEVAIAAPAGNCVFVNPGDPCVFALNTTTNLGLREPQAEGYSSPTVQPTYGTSFSTPLVAASAGLMKALNPALTPSLLVARIRETARPFPVTSDTVPQPPVCALPATAGNQISECICTTALCGAGLLDTDAAVRAALRPAVMAQVNGTIAVGRTLTLDGSGSAAATGRSVARFQWSVDSTSGGAATPVLTSADTAIATMPSPSQGSITLRLTVTDNLGASDSARVTVAASGGTSTDSPPPATSGSGGGGASSTGLLLLAAALLGWRLRRPTRIHD